MSGHRPQSRARIVPDECKEYRSWRPSVTYYHSSHEFPRRPPYEYPPPRNPAPSTPYDWEYLCTPPPAPPPPPPPRYHPDPRPAANLQQQWNTGYEPEGRRWGGRTPPPEEETGWSSTKEDIVRPMGPSPTHGTTPTPDQPFVLMRCALDAFELAQHILEFRDYAYGTDSITTIPVIKFLQDLTSYGVVLRDIREGERLCNVEEVTSKVPDARSTVAWYSARASLRNSKVRNLIAECEAAMPEEYRNRDGSIKLEACLEFTRTLFGRREELGDLSFLMRDLRESYNNKCAPQVKFMRDEDQRIEREGRRRREEAQWSEEESHRRDERGYSKKRR